MDICELYSLITAISCSIIKCYELDEVFIIGRALLQLSNLLLTDYDINRFVINPGLAGPGQERKQQQEEEEEEQIIGEEEADDIL